MHAPQIIMILWIGMRLGVQAVKHGETRKPNKFNFWSELIAAAIFAALLYWGGFF